MRILYVTQEMDPYTAISEVSEAFKRLPQFVNDKSHEIRVLMPKYGLINERRHRLHEVVRLSGMNIIVNDEDYPLIIKVASLPGARLQVYFLDNEEFFKRKYAFINEAGKPFDDNVERMVFFCKGVMETVRKFGWPPEIIHCHGSLTALIPLFVKKVYHNDPIFKDAKVLYSAYTDLLSQTLNKSFEEIAAINDLDAQDLANYKGEKAINLNKGAMHFSDAVFMGTAAIEEEYSNLMKNKPHLPFMEESELLPAMVDFYKKILE